MAQTRMSASHLSPLISELDPSNKYGPRRIWAALKALGLEPRDIDPESAQDVITVTDKIPDPARATRVKEQRKEVWEGLRQSRLKELRELLEGMPDDDVGRFEKTGNGVRSVQPDDLPSSENLGGMGDFAAMQAAKYAKVKAEQQRKANSLVTGFLTEKKRMEEADAKITAFEQRLKDQKKAQNDEMKVKRIEAAKKAERRQQLILKTNNERAAYEEATDIKVVEKLARARATRIQTYSKDNLQVKIQAAEAKRHAAFRQAADLEQTMLRNIEAKQEACELRLAADKERQDMELSIRRNDTQAAFERKRMKIYEMEQDWIINKLTDHGKAVDKYATAKAQYKANLKLRSKSCGDITKKATEKWRASYDKELAAHAAAGEAFMQRYHEDSNKSDANAALKLKCDVDIHSFQEQKYNTWGELQRRRITELQKSRDAHTQALVFEVAERQKKDEVKDYGNNEMKKRRQTIAKETLSLNDRATEAFIKMKSEPDEGKIRGMMLNLGFSMPKLPVEDGEEAGP